MMADDRPRYAIYYAPACDSALWRLGSSILGYDAVRAVACDHPPELVARFPDWNAWTREPRRYGFHATLKAPFRLAEGAGEPDVLAATEALARRLGPASMGRLSVARNKQCLTLELAGNAMPVTAIAGQAVSALDHLRAPLTAVDRARRLQSALSPGQLDLLDRWGYPYVFEEFHFHMTLTGAVAADSQAHVRAEIGLLLARIPHPTTLDRIALFKQRLPHGPFQCLQMFRLGP